MSRKRMILVVLSVAITVVGSLSTGAASTDGAASSEMSGVFTRFTAKLNGVTVQEVTLPGIPRKLPIQGEIGGKVLPCTSGVAGSTQEAALCAGPSKNFFFQWWMSVWKQESRPMYEFSQWYDWTGDGSQVTYFDTECFDNGGYWNYNGCSTTHTRTGTSAVRVRGSWTYICCYNNSWGYTKRPWADVTAAADGSIWGTVHSG